MAGRARRPLLDVIFMAAAVALVLFCVSVLAAPMVLHSAAAVAGGDQPRMHRHGLMLQQGLAPHLGYGAADIPAEQIDVEHYEHHLYG